MGESRVIVTCMKNECPYILEWIAYHLEIGFTHFVVATNDCSDGTARLLSQLADAGLVTHVRNPAPHGRGPQRSGYFRCRNLDVVRKADWLMTLDVDEFVNLHPGAGRLDDLFAAVPEANMISLQWQMFGHSGQRDFRDDLVISQFTRASHPHQVAPQTLRAVKTIYRGGLFERLGTHRPNQPVEAARSRIRWVDGDGGPMPRGFVERGWSGKMNGRGLGTTLGRINHYAVRSIDAFLIKRDRGDVNPGRDHSKVTGSGLEYWDIHDWNLVEDLTIQRHIPAVRDRIGALRKIGRVDRLHRIGVDWHSRKIAELRKRADMQALRAALIERSGRETVLEPGAIRMPEPVPG